MKYGYIERERRFLLRALPSELSLTNNFRRIRDRYFSETHLRLREITSPDGEVLDRKFAKKETLTESANCKITNLYLSELEYQLLFALGGLEICKRRYRYSIDEHVAAIDVFENALQGLILAEVEFTSDEAMQQFQPPSLFEIEVTEDPFFRGGNLAKIEQETLQEALKTVFR